jgi:hypothetical protein
MDLPQNLTDEAAYIAENFGITLTRAIELTLAKAEKDARKKKRVGR